MAYWEVRVLPYLLAFAQYAGYLKPSRRWDRPQKNLETISTKQYKLF